MVGNIDKKSAAEEGTHLIKYQLNGKMFVAYCECNSSLYVPSNAQSREREDNFMFEY